MKASKLIDAQAALVKYRPIRSQHHPRPGQDAVHNQHRRHGLARPQPRALPRSLRML